MEFLCKYDFEVKYIQEKNNVVADTLSQKRCETLALNLSVDLRSHLV